MLEEENNGVVGEFNPVGPMSYLGVLRTIITDYIHNERVLAQQPQLPKELQEELLTKLSNYLSFINTYAHSSKFILQLNMRGVFELWTRIRENDDYSDFLFFLTSKFKLYYSDRWNNVIEDVANAFYFTLKVPSTYMDENEDVPVDSVIKDLLNFKELVKMYTENHWLIILSLIYLMEPILP